MASALRRVDLLLLATLLATPLFAQKEREPIPNWPVPPFWSPPDATATSAETRDEQHGRGATGAEAQASTYPLPFISITPCRVVDTRGNGFVGLFGPPSLVAGVPREFPLGSPPCATSSSARAVSLNITVTNTLGPGFIRIYAAGTPAPNTSTLNYVAGQTVANAAIVQLGTGILGNVTVVAAVSGTDLIIDMNGYFGSSTGASGAGDSNVFLGDFAGNSSISGTSNTGIGYSALRTIADGNYNAAIGFSSLYFNTSGGGNTASGAWALYVNTTGSGNTASGYFALIANRTGNNNTAIGDQALLGNNTGSNNTASGVNALLSNIAGSNNIGIGFNAGANVTAGDNNIYIGNGGPTSESGAIRIGDSSLHTQAFVAGIRDVTTANADAVPVVIDSAGQLGTISSSARFKEEVEDMAEASSRLLKLRPVTFRYKGQAGRRKQFGLIAEEVEEVLPELVVSDSAGEAETVLYHEMPAMLLNELQKQQKTIEHQASEIEQLKAEVAALRRAVSH